MALCRLARSLGMVGVQRDSDLGDTRNVQKGGLNPSFGVDSARFGPELGFGWHQGWNDGLNTFTANQGYHWNQNGESYYLIGDAMGQGMEGLLTAP